MKKIILAATAVSTMTCATLGTAQTRTGGGTATYWMSAETMSGFAAASSAQNGRPNVAGIMMARGGNAPAYVHNLTLQLGSGQRPQGAPSAEHLPPAGLAAGPSLPLLTPQPAAPSQYSPRTTPGNADGVRGRILIYWGCGEHVRQGQPFEIDLSRMAQGQVPSAFANLPFRLMNPPSAATSSTYGEWPNERSRVTIPASGSLVGDHLVRGNYSP